VEKGLPHRDFKGSVPELLPAAIIPEISAVQARST
jgi:hypothetical protein